LSNKKSYQQFEPSPINPVKHKLDLEPSLEEVLNESYNDDIFLPDSPKSKQ
jgi:hypothetical protein